MCFAGSYILHGDPVSDQYGCGGGRGGEGEEGERERERRRTRWNVVVSGEL